MANVDAPRGFTPIKYANGASWRGECRAITPKDGADIFIGDAITLDTGTADQYASGDACLGVCVGVGKNTTDGTRAAAFNVDNLNVASHYDDSENTNTDYSIYFVPAGNMVFQVQSAIDASAAVVGTVYDVAVGTGVALTGRSAMELTTDSNHDIEVVELPQIIGNDPTLINAEYYVQFITQPFAQE